ncbi:MAG: TM2 domain-containing membrane protein YozV [Myxococcota bacterium]|jgi:TM2 domain-containing membrane protein YozV
MTTAIAPRDSRSPALAYLLWVPCMFGICGLHRLYAGRWVSGIVWFLTGGLCGVGQAVDLLFIPRMVSDHNDGRPVW